MASFSTACRFSAQLAARHARTDVSLRGLRTSTKCLAVQNFTMPALSPTMTEGNIASWSVKEGDSFSAGDVLLEIETDKASMDVEAQDDGILAKITQGDGSKGVKVGMRIGVIAEPGDDLNSLEIPEEDSPSVPSPNEEAANPNPATTPESQAGAPPALKSSDSASAKSPSKETSGNPRKQTYPLFPSVERLLRDHGLDKSAVQKMTPSGPNGRLLKGDVLAYLGSVSSSYPSELSTRIEKLSHLDLSNIKIATPVGKAAKAGAPAPEPLSQDLQVAVPISMKAVTEVQNRIQTTLGVFMPLSTFIARATDVANDDLPRSKSFKPSTDDLFNQVLGLDKVSAQTGTRGHFLPQITALPQISHRDASVRLNAKQPDIIDILAGKRTSRVSRIHAPESTPGLSASVNVFSVTVPKGDQRMAEVFLDRVKAMLELEPGRLVL